MDEKQIKELKAAIQKMDAVVNTLAYHSKLRTAWAGLKKLIAPLLIADQPEQKEIFPGS